MGNIINLLIVDWLKKAIKAILNKQNNILQYIICIIKKCDM